MKIVSMFLFFVLVSATVAVADTTAIQLDKTFSSAQKWLAEKNLTLTGGGDGARDDVAAFVQGDLVFYGEAAGNSAHSYPGQREVMAKRAAVVFAQRAVAEYLSGFALVGNTEVRDGMITSDAIRSAVSSVVKGTQVVFQEYSPEKNMALAIIKIKMRGQNGLSGTMYSKLLNDPKLQETLKAEQPDYKAPPAAEPVVTEPYDGLIIDATGHNFRPALINRICSAKGEIIYDPAKISQKVLVEQGCGEYSNTIDKAKAALSTRGVKNPLVVKAAGTVTASDLQVTDQDASVIFTSNQKIGYFSAAKVAFVVK